MAAGDAALQSEIIQRVGEEVNRRIQIEPNNWWLVRDVANLYSRHYEAARAARAENAVLAPLGLNHNTYMQRQREMAPELVMETADRLQQFEIATVQATISGIDSTGAHIYVLHNSEVMCQDQVGFAAIGVGGNHAASEFMFAQHTRFRPFPETWLLTYSAKKRAEVAPGVGQRTDMFVVGPVLGSLVFVGDDVLRALEEIYRTTQAETIEANGKAEASINQYIKNMLDRQSVVQQTPPPSTSSPTEPPQPS